MNEEVDMRFCKSIKVLRCALVGVGILLGSGAVAQKYYVAKEGDMSIHFGYKDGISTAESKEVDIIFNRKKITLWITIKGSDFKTGNWKIDKRLFRKNENEFVIKAYLIQENVIYGGDEFFRFSLIGRVFNKVEGGPVSIMGAFGDSPDGRKENLSLYMYFGVASKWMGDRFLKHSDYPVVNIRITAELEPVIGTD